ncbi:MAG: tetratricopeptide repeat protein [Pyrinomonadaceae bacterium]|nr:tetratricopeptide repeat protein [Pyrinomonadaceae bacterium]
MLYYLAYAHDRQGNLTAARERAEASLKQDSQSPEANKLLSRILFKQGQAAAALEFLEKAIAQKPLDSESRFLRARICRQLGRAKDAAREFAEVEQLKAKEREREDVQNRRP